MRTSPDTISGKTSSRLFPIEPRLLSLCVLHYVVDYFGGLLAPLPEPTLTSHLNVNLGSIALLLGGCALLTNVIQPLSGCFFPRRGIPVILLIAPIFAALSCLIGLSHSVRWTGMVLVLSSIGIGLLHPEAALAAHSLSKRHPGFGMALFVSGGYFGFSCGSLISGFWVHHHDQDLSSFWILGVPVIPALGLVLLTRLHRLTGHVPEHVSSQVGPFPFHLVWPMAICIATNMCLLVRFITILSVRRFPEPSAQAWGGAAVFATGISGSLGSFLWGYLSDKLGKARVILFLQFACQPFLYMATHASSPMLTPLWSVGVGLTMGATFPMAVLLARQARGLGERLKMGLAIGGSWGIGEIVFILAGIYVGRFPPGDPVPVFRIYWICWVLLVMTAVLAFLVSKREPTSWSPSENLFSSQRRGGARKERR